MNKSSILAIALLWAGLAYGQVGSFVGTVTDSASGNPLTGAKVVLSTGVIGGTGLDTVTTAADGKYRFDSLATGKKNRYTLSVSDSGYRTEYQSNLTLNAGQVDTVDFALSKDSGTVVPLPATGSFTGMVADGADSTPLQGAMVILSEAGGVLGMALDTAWTAANGTYMFQDISTGIRKQFSLNVSASGYEPASATRLTLDSGQVDTVDFYLNAMVDSTSWVAMGKVTADSAKGTPLTGVMVEFIRRVGTEVRYTGKTDTNGMYAILLPNAAAVYQIQASLAGYLTLDSIYQMAGDSATVDLALMKDTSGTSSERLSGGSGVWAAVFPNPAKGVATLSVLGAKGSEIGLYTPAGRRVYSAKVRSASARIAVATNRLPTGFYLWRVKAAGQIQASGRILVIK